MGVFDEPALSQAEKPDEAELTWTLIHRSVLWRGQKTG